MKEKRFPDLLVHRVEERSKVPVVSVPATVSSWIDVGESRARHDQEGNPIREQSCHFIELRLWLARLHQWQVRPGAARSPAECLEDTVCPVEDRTI